MSTDSASASSDASASAPSGVESAEQATTMAPGSEVTLSPEGDPGLSRSGERAALVVPPPDTDAETTDGQAQTDDGGHRVIRAGPHEFVGTRHTTDYHHPDSEALRATVEAWMERTEGIPRVIMREGFRGPDEGDSGEEAFAKWAEGAWLSWFGNEHGIPCVTAEESAADQASAVIAAGNDPRTVFAYYVMRDPTQIFRADGQYRPPDMGAYMAELTESYASMLPPGADDPLAEFGEIFHRLYPDRPFDGAFVEADVPFLLNQTVDPIGDVPATSPVQLVAVAVNERRDAVVAEMTNEKVDAGFAVLVVFGDLHLENVVKDIPIFATAPVSRLGGGQRGTNGSPA